MKTCGSKDCPNIHPEIVNQLCEIYYPYGGSKCRKHFKFWLENEPEVRRLDGEYGKDNT